MVLIILTLSVGTFTQDVIGRTQEDKQLDEFIKENKYISADEAISQFEKRYEKQVILPKKLPFEPTDRFGKLDEEGRLKLHFMRIGKSEEYTTLDFSFYIMPENEIYSFIETNDEVYTLNNGDKAFYRQHHKHFHSFAFSTNKLGYFFGANPNKIDLVTFIKIAESIN